MSFKVLLLAGEESGVLYARQIRDEILRRYPGAEIRGYGDYGFKIEDLAVFGIWAVLKRIGYFLLVRRTMEAAINEWRPNVVCTIDYPGMNLRLAAYAKARGIRAVHVVCPQVWAWHQGRIPKIERTLDALCCFLPFEPKIFKPGFAAFVGHPLVEEMSRELRKEGPRKEAGDRRVLSVLPGSRMGEIAKHLPIMVEVIGVLRREIPQLQAVMPAANERAYARISSYLKSNGVSGVTVTKGGAREALRTSDAAIVASGTATFEAAIVNCPFVVVYRVSAVLAMIARRVVKGVRHVGLVNVIAEKAGRPCPMPELLQEDFTAERVLAEVRPWLTDKSANAEARRRLAEAMRPMESEEGAIGRIVDIIGGPAGT